jgi:hypothetical protein
MHGLGTALQGAAWLDPFLGALDDATIAIASSKGIKRSAPVLFDELRERLQGIVITYSDDRGIARYAQRMDTSAGRGAPLSDAGLRRLR